jgi:hypothetical protein
MLGAYNAQTGTRGALDQKDRELEDFILGLYFYITLHFQGLLPTD